MRAPVGPELPELPEQTLVGRITAREPTILGFELWESTRVRR